MKKEDKKETFFVKIDKNNIKKRNEVGKYEIQLPCIGSGRLGEVLIGYLKEKDKPVNYDAPFAVRKIPNTIFCDFKDELDTEYDLLLKEKYFDAFPKLLYELAQTKNNSYLPFELFEYSSLQYQLDHKKYFPEEIICDAIWEVANHIQRFHLFNYIHRNIAPENILIKEDPKTGEFHYKLCGLHKALRISEAGNVPKIWYNQFRSPESCLGLFYGKEEDIWSLGVTIFMLATGKSPYDVDQDFIINRRAENKLKYPPETKISKNLATLIEGCLAYDPKNRFDIEDVIDSKFLSSSSASSGLKSTLNSQIAKKDSAPPKPISEGIGEEQKSAYKPSSNFSKFEGKSDEEKYYLAKEDLYTYFQYYIDKNCDKNTKLQAKKKDNLDEYENESEIYSTGAYSKVFACFRKSDGKKVIRKIVANYDNLNELDHLLIEIEILLDMKDTPFSVELYDHFIYNNNMNLILEYCNGSDLKQYMKKLPTGQNLTLDDIKLIAWDVACGLDYLHKKHNMHRDLKPDNILLKLDENGKIICAKLCDYGLGKKCKLDKFVRKLEATSNIGTSSYKAPELRDWTTLLTYHPDCKYSHKIDVYSYGIILYYMIYKNLPMRGFIAYPSKPEIPESYIDLIKECLGENPHKRPEFSELTTHQFFFTVKPSNMDKFPYNEIILIGESKDKTIQTIVLEKDSKYYTAKRTKKHMVSNKEVWSEIDSLYKLQGCKNVIKYVDHFIYGNYLYIVMMGYYADGNLKKYIKNLNYSLSFEEQAFIAYQILVGLKEIHTHNIIHRNMHYKNILIKKNNANGSVQEIVLCNFGASKALVPGNSTKSMLNVAFKSPEQTFWGKNGPVHSMKTDIWAYGMVLYYIIFGKNITSNPNFDEVTFKKHGNLPVSKEYRWKANADLYEIMKKCFTVDENDRPTAEILLREKVFDPFTKYH